MTSKIKHPRYILFLAVFAISGPAFAALIPWGEALVAGFDLAVLVFILSCVPLWRRSGPDAIRRQAERDDAGQVMLLLLSGVISVVALAALTQLILEKAGAGGRGRLRCWSARCWQAGRSRTWC
ncbi:hypothetical protein ACFSTD_14210 [Novosphingobium colocasiae]